MLNFIFEIVKANFGFLLLVGAIVVGVLFGASLQGKVEQIASIQKENKELKSEVAAANEHALRIDTYATQLSVKLDEYKVELLKYKSKEELWSDRTVLMGTLHNNNWSAIQGQRPDEIVYINQDWTINHLPNLLDLTDDNRNFLDKFLSKEVPLKGRTKFMPGRE